MIIDDTLILRVIRYIITAIVIFLILRYFPNINLDPMKAATITAILVIIFLILEYLCMNSKENFSSCAEKNCNSCASGSGLLGGTSNTPDNSQKTCRIVCDGPTCDQPRQPTPSQVSSCDSKVYVNPQGKPSKNDENHYWGSKQGKMAYDSRYGFGGMFYDENPAYNRFNNNDKCNPRNIGHAQEGPRQKDCADDMASNRELKAQYANRTTTTSGYTHPWQTIGDKSERNRATEINKQINGDLDDELPYSDYNHLPVAAGQSSHEYEYGYSYLPPEKWYPQPPRPPICVTDKRCPVCPVFTTGLPADVKEFHSSRRITPPDTINTEYINDKLNSGI